MNRQLSIFSLFTVRQSRLIGILTSGFMLSGLLFCPIFSNNVWATSLDDWSAGPITQTTSLSTIGVVEQSEYSNQIFEEKAEPYEYSNRPSADGIGKFYMGREIAQVMGHQGAAWLERPSRIQEEKPHVLMVNLDIQPTDVIADIGAGTGYLTLRLASKVPQGKVLAVDVQPEMLNILSDRIDQSNPDAGFDNVELILASADDPHLAVEVVDMAIMLDVYHELEYPYEVIQQVVQALRPGGKMVLVEYRGENPLVPIKRLHKMTEKQVRKEMKAVGLTWVETNEELPRQHLMIFEKA